MIMLTNVLKKVELQQTITLNELVSLEIPGVSLLFELHVIVPDLPLLITMRSASKPLYAIACMDIPINIKCHTLLNHMRGIRLSYMNSPISLGMPPVSFLVYGVDIIFSAIMLIVDSTTMTLLPVPVIRDPKLFGIFYVDAAFPTLKLWLGT